MNKSIYGKFVALALLLVVVVPVLPAVAQDDTGTSTDAVEEVGDVGILPTNPFYFIKEWGRGIARAFILDPVKRAEYELRVVDEKAKELESVSDLDGENDRGIDRAARNYEDSIGRLRDRLERLDETSENPQVSRLLENLDERAEDHQALIERLRIRYEQFEELRMRFEQAKDTVDGVVDSVRMGVSEAERLQMRVRSGDVELKQELEDKLQEFRRGVESSGAIDKAQELEGEFRLRILEEADRLQLKERLPLIRQPEDRRHSEVEDEDDEGEEDDSRDDSEEQ